MRRFIGILVWLGMVSLMVAQEDAEAYKAARGIDNLSERIQALEAFVNHYSQSNYKADAYNALFQAYLQTGQGDRAVEAAENYLATMPAERRGSAYNGLAWQLAEKKTDLEAAARYARLAEEWARSLNNPRQLRNILDTRAYVHYQMGDYPTAEALQREAVVGNEEDPEFIGRLAVYEEAVGKRAEALRTVARTLLFGGGDEYLAHFHAWLEKEAPEAEQRRSLKEQIINETVQAYINEGKAGSEVQKRSLAAGLMARTGVDLPRARQWAEAAVASINDRTDLNDELTYRSRLAAVYFAQGEYSRALETVAPVVDIASPWEEGFWYMLGQIYEKSGDNGKALQAYLQGLTVFQPEKLKFAAGNVLEKISGSSTGLDQQIEKARQQLLNFDPGQYQGFPATGGAAVLAELFTGAECNPCVGSDYAFDALAKYYPRSLLVILEHHLHIPGPDPLTNDDTEARYQFYGRNFGTPTVFINGRDKITGGGPKMVTPNRFTLYNRLIQKHLQTSPVLFTISGSANLAGDMVTVDLQIEALNGNAPAGQNIRWNVALVERSVDYLGANGVAHHAFVVRKLSGGGEGMPLALQNSRASIQTSIELAAVETEISAYLDEWEQKNTSRFRGGGSWRARPEKLNRDNLALVAWVQDISSKEVLQAFYLEVPPASGQR